MSKPSSYTKVSSSTKKVVLVGGIPIGGENKIALQSMLTVPTLKTELAVEQCIRLVEAGCELIRITAASIKEAENLEHIRNELVAKGYNVPLVADIHFTPNAAVAAAAIVDKVRINPGNFIKDRLLDSGQEKLLLKKNIRPLLELCKEKGTSIRIGVNHGSLSESILQKYGNTALGMVESALNYLNICEELNFHEIIVSLKASNVRTMIEANRLMQERMIERGSVYPLHLGVTEAGSGDDGRIKSAIGIGTLLLNGIGDTIRVSLSEEPEKEIPVAEILREKYAYRSRLNTDLNFPLQRKADRKSILNGKGGPSIFADFSHLNAFDERTFNEVGHFYSKRASSWQKTDFACDFIYLGSQIPLDNFPSTAKYISNYSDAVSFGRNHFPLFSLSKLHMTALHPTLNFLAIKSIAQVEELQYLKEKENIVFVIDCGGAKGVRSIRELLQKLDQQQFKNPIILRNEYAELCEEEWLVSASVDFGSLIIEGYGDGLWIKSPQLSLKKQNSMLFGILQAIGDRISKTEYISCPSCGRAQFDVPKTKEKIEAATAHLKGLKIGIMGCIVNGPGEMAGADYGYVGSGKGKISLYKGHKLVRKDVSENTATEAIIELIKESGDWKEKGEL